MAKLFILILTFFITISSVQAQDPTNKKECVDMLKIQVEKQCTTLLGGNNEDMEIACLEGVLTETEKQ